MVDFETRKKELKALEEQIVDERDRLLQLVQEREEYLEDKEKRIISREQNLLAREKKLDDMSAKLQKIVKEHMASLTAEGNE